VQLGTHENVAEALETIHRVWRIVAEYTSAGMDVSARFIGSEKKIRLLGCNHLWGF
jgi:hypothetical protein